ncbi:hypothetical protein FHQ18_09480 [Deferribacter autotrophicus]|uniref:Protease complex subunit PrcB family protein n=1 Tax=Deferribacter autotrophicus TaxID=500465 RepID=A0A5A8F119_9BACT|nr:hypothetical protein [Deferribacter autotrophicus]KAA0257561.1 hypothetical protein FHQ18_09480 [Deferribacter autotrophicus]
MRMLFALLILLFSLNLHAENWELLLKGKTVKCEEQLEKYGKYAPECKAYILFKLTPDIVIKKTKTFKFYHFLFFVGDKKHPIDVVYTEYNSEIVAIRIDKLPPGYTAMVLTTLPDEIAITNIAKKDTFYYFPINNPLNVRVVSNTQK